jgi:hypothetical protein
MKRLNFSNITLDKLNEVIKLEFFQDSSVFKPLTEFQYEISEDEEEFLKHLIDRNLQFVDFYTEEELKMKFLSFILNRVDFYSNEIKDWYERNLKGEINGILLNGTTDFMVAKGLTEPKEPYFFIQEFKKTKISSLPLPQLLAEMVVAIELNKSNSIFGAYIIGKRWDFVFLEKFENCSYRYAISESFDSFKLRDLKSIYKNLQAVKSLYCKKS